MKKLLSLVLVAVLCVSMIIVANAKIIDYMTDVSDKDWAHDAIDYVTENGYMGGTNSATFDPAGKVTRAQAAQVLYNLSDNKETTIKSPFTDVKDTDWFNDSVVWCYENKVVNGTSKTTFGPSSNVTRQDLCVMFYNYYKDYLKQKIDVDVESVLSAKYKDWSDVATYAKTAMNWANKVGFLNGNSDGTINPRGYATRREMAQMLVNFDKVQGIDVAQKVEEAKVYAVVDKDSTPYKGTGTTEDPYVILVNEKFTIDKEFLALINGETKVEEDDPSSTPEGDDPSSTPEGDDPSSTPEEDDPSSTPEGDDPSSTPEESDVSDVVSSEPKNDDGTTSDTKDDDTSSTVGGDTSSSTEGDNTSSTPDDGTSSKPDDDTSSTPDDGTSSKPDDGTSSTPDDGTSSKPDDGTSSTPDDGDNDSKDPVVKEPIKITGKCCVVFELREWNHPRGSLLGYTIINGIDKTITIEHSPSRK